MFLIILEHNLARSCISIRNMSLGCHTFSTRIHSYTYIHIHTYIHTQTVKCDATLVHELVKAASALEARATGDKQHKSAHAWCAESLTLCDHVLREHVQARLGTVMDDSMTSVTTPMNARRDDLGSFEGAVSVFLPLYVH